MRLYQPLRIAMLRHILRVDGNGHKPNPLFITVLVDGLSCTDTVIFIQFPDPINHRHNVFIPYADFGMDIVGAVEFLNFNCYTIHVLVHFMNLFYLVVPSSTAACTTGGTLSNLTTLASLTSLPSTTSARCTTATARPCLATA